MSRDASITLTWADGDYLFALKWGQLTQLQEACEAGPFVVLERLSSRTWRVEDISNVIRLGLIGGGMEPIKALKLVRAYVEARPPVENLLTAQVILSAGVIGAPDEDSVKKNGSPEETGSTVSLMENSE